MAHKLPLLPIDRGENYVVLKRRWSISSKPSYHDRIKVKQNALTETELLALSAVNWNNYQLYINKSVFSFLRRLTTWHCPHSCTINTHRRSPHTATAARCCWPPAVQHNYLLLVGPTAAACGGRMGQTDRGTDRQKRTDARQLHIDRAPHSVRQCQ